ncbi:ABC transporter ATP-binding protein [Rhizomonospora bruguierae]|uniref:ABC transporter ATP-binding protein n=1 Tax=Rhizomonospora bruguierae TaxID=1581705 RepID=UPI001BCB7548|nr:ABC transporter ATP-binding protein [Micromonospora sp. NBRC 107566]
MSARASALIRGFGGRTVLDGLDLEIPDGQFVALLGRSGSGKSTLLRAFAGLDFGVAGSGEVAVPDRVSVVFQDSRLLPWRRVLDNVVLGLAGGGTARLARRSTARLGGRGTAGRGTGGPGGRSAGGLTARDARERGRAALAEVGLAGRERAWPAELSGGEQQRVSLARSLVTEPRLLLADEPFGALDALTRIRMHGLLRRLCERHRPAVLLVTHDVDEAIVLADRVVVLDAGRIGLDLTVDLPGRRSPADPHYLEYRGLLLDALGVREPGAKESEGVPA